MVNCNIPVFLRNMDGIYLEEKCESELGKEEKKRIKYETSEREVEKSDTVT